MNLVSVLLLALSFGHFDQVLSENKGDPLIYSEENGAECKTIFCFEKKGHFNQDTFFTLTPALPETKVVRSQFQTNIVIYITEIEAATDTPNLVICEGSNCQQLENSDSQLLVYRNVYDVTFFKVDPSLKFKVRFYIGCGIFDQSNIQLIGKVDDLLRQQGKCWILIPRLYDDSKIQHTVTTYAIFKNITMPEGASFSLYDLLTGDALVNISGTTALDGTVVKPIKSPVSYLSQKKISTALLFETNNCEKCSNLNTDFSFIIQALGEFDSKCVEEKQGCSLKVAQEFGYDCEKVKKQKCSAFTKLNDVLDKNLIEEDDLSSRLRKSTGNLMLDCKIAFAKREWSTICKKVSKTKFVECKLFGDCEKYCLVWRFATSMCTRRYKII